MSKDSAPPPTSVVLGLNSNIAINDQVLHVQTEDLGRKYSEIVTHVFSKTGQVVRVVRFDYGKYRDKPNLRDVLGRALQVQHANVVRALKQEGGAAQEPVPSAPAPAPSAAAPAPGFWRVISRVFRVLLNGGNGRGERTDK